MKINILLIYIIILTSINISYSQNFTLLQQSFSPQTASIHFEEATDIARTSDAGFVVSGYWGDSAFIMKFDCLGDSLWLKYYYRGNGKSGFNGIVVMPNGDIVAGGYCTNCRLGDPKSKSWAVRTDNQGNTLQDTVLGVFGKNTRSYDIQMTPDSGFVLAGEIEQGGLLGWVHHLVKLDHALAPEWSKQYNTRFIDETRAVTPTADGGFAFIGNAQFFNSSTTLFVYRTDSAGNQLWRRGINSPNSSQDALGYDILTDSSGNLVILGNIFVDSMDALVMKLDPSSGATLDSATFGSPNTDLARDIVPDFTGGYMVAATLGTQIDSLSGLTGWILTLDQNLDSVNSFTYGYNSLTPELQAIIPRSETPETFVAVGSRTNTHVSDVEFFMRKITVEFQPLSSVCIDLPGFTLTGGSPLAGVYDGPGVVNDTFHAAIAGAGLHTITYTFTDSLGCPETVSQTIEVFSLPIISILPTDTTCENNVSFPVLTSPLGGVFTGPGMNDSIFQPNIAGVGNHVITYTFTDSNSCVSADSQTITVFPKPIVSLTPLDTLCFNEPAIILSGGSPIGGNYQGVGIIDSVFTPASAGVGTHPITYSFINENGCSDSVTQEITILSSPMVSFAPLPIICEGSDTLTLFGGSPIGGLYQGPGVMGNIFHPDSVGVGTYPIEYLVVNNEGCKDSAIQDLEVAPLPSSPTIMSSVDTLFTGLSGTHVWYLDGNIISGENDSVIIANTTGDYQVSVIDENGCESLLSKEFTHIVSSIDFAEENGLDVQIYPNPARDYFVISLENLTIKKLTVELRTVTGQLSYQKELLTSGGKLEENVSLSSLAKGVYFLLITHENQLIYTEKIIKH